MHRTSQYIFIQVVLVFIAGCDMKSGKGEYNSIMGFTQGTSYHITYQHPATDDLQKEIDSLLRDFDSSLSSYDSSSIISAINRNDKEVITDSLFRTVFREARRVYQVSGGAFDITLAPIIDAWGFGPGQAQELDSAMIDSLLQYVGMDKVSLIGSKVYKSNPNVKLNVNAIAQGFAVDVVSNYLNGKGIKNFMVEIGGEIRTQGMNPKGNFWRIGIDRPEKGNMVPGEQLQVILSMHNRSLATSGNYRKFYIKDGIMITHSIDPVTGFPKVTNLLSATVLTDDCMSADAYATSCMVLGLENAIEFIESQKGVDAYFIYGDDFGNYQAWYTQGLRKYIESQ